MMIRDEKSKALINNDLEALNKYKMERKQFRKMEELVKEMTEIKTKLASVCERLEKVEKA
jgi:DNA-binding transcriptional regulator GbsR (MarR family)